MRARIARETSPKNSILNKFILDTMFVNEEVPEHEKMMSLRRLIKSRDLTVTVTG